MLPIQQVFSQTSVNQALLLVSNQNNQIRENGIDILQSLFAFVSSSASEEVLNKVATIALRTEGM